MFGSKKSAAKNVKKSGLFAAASSLFGAEPQAEETVDGGDDDNDDDNEAVEAAAAAEAEEARAVATAAAAAGVKAAEDSARLSDLKKELEGMKLRALTAKAEEMGVDEDMLDDAEEKSDVIALIMEVESARVGVSVAAAVELELKAADAKARADGAAYMKKQATGEADSKAKQEQAKRAFAAASKAKAEAKAKADKEAESEAAASEAAKRAEDQKQKAASADAAAQKKETEAAAAAATTKKRKKSPSRGLAGLDQKANAHDSAALSLVELGEPTAAARTSGGANLLERMAAASPRPEASPRSAGAPSLLERMKSSSPRPSPAAAAKELQQQRVEKMAAKPKTSAKNEPPIIKPKVFVAASKSKATQAKVAAADPSGSPQRTVVGAGSTEKEAAERAALIAGEDEAGLREQELCDFEARILREKRERYEASDEYKELMEKRKTEREIVALAEGAQISEGDVVAELGSAQRRSAEQAAKWIGDVLGGDDAELSTVLIDAAKSDDGGLQEALKSGAVLCALVNKVSPGAVKTVSDSSKPFPQRENVKAFIDNIRVRRPQVFPTTTRLNVGNIE